MNLFNRIAVAAAITALACTSVAESNKLQLERAAIRRVLGSSTMQVLDLN